MRQIILIFLFATSLQMFSQSINVVQNKHYNLENGVAIQGYDPLSYFSENKASKGKSNISTKYNEVVYYFSSKKNKKMFDSNPTKYEPQYGGWCAFAMGDYGKKAEVNPETFKIVEDK